MEWIGVVSTEEPARISYLSGRGKKDSEKDYGREKRHDERMCRWDRSQWDRRLSVEDVEDEIEEEREEKIQNDGGEDE